MARQTLCSATGYPINWTTARIKAYTTTELQIPDGRKTTVQQLYAEGEGHYAIVFFVFCFCFFFLSFLFPFPSHVNLSLSLSSSSIWGFHDPETRTHLSSFADIYPCSRQEPFKPTYSESPAPPGIGREREPHSQKLLTARHGMAPHGMASRSNS